ncbi:diguanylate cyclase (GGDEF)-like protein/PAS domain S-box-containing protein [Neobacillus niacini]|nr:diguanylate cyclase (GGDEF)-like protein/PAS domain S-box-containing protein [Neobacillus niacini]
MILITFLFVGHQIYFFSYSNLHSKFISKWLYGLGYGVLGIALMYFSIQVNDTTKIDLRYVVIVLSALHGGFATSLSASIVIALGRILLFGINTSSIAGVISALLVGFLLGMISKYLRQNHWKNWLILQLISLFVSSIFLTYLLKNTDLLWETLTYFWGFSLLVSVISNYLLIFIFKSSNDSIDLIKRQYELIESKAKLSVTLDSIGDGVITTDINGKITYMNPIAETLTGWLQEESLGKDHQEILNIINEYSRGMVESPITKALAQKRVVGLDKDTLLITKKGTELPIDDSASPIIDHQGKIIGAVMVFRDLFEIKKYEEQIRYYAFHDTLTELPNRRLFYEKITTAMANSQRNSQPMALLFIDLDHFKFINDSLGHDIGDLLIKEVSSRLVACVREKDIVTRLGGDEFTIILENISKEELEQIAKRVIQSLSASYMLKGNELFITPSIGISTAPEDGTDVDTMIKNADTAMYYVKMNGKNNYFYFNKEMNQQINRKMMIDKGLRKAIEKNEFILYYQPKVELGTGKIIGVEALIRWMHPEMGMVPPSEFISIAEETGQIKAIGKWVLHTACKQGQEWVEKGFPPLRIAVNVSLQQLMQDDFIHNVEETLHETGFNPENLEMEITESVMQSGEYTIKVLHKLKEMGIYISIDDFGTGYSSLSYLKRLPLNALKIDKSFVDDIQIDQTDSDIVKTIIALAKTLKLKCIAEGVETADQSHFLKENGCHEVQGYYISKPIHVKEFEKLIA